MADKTSERDGKDMERKFISHWECGIKGCDKKDIRHWHGNSAGDLGKHWPMCPQHGSPMVLTSNAVEGTLDVMNEEAV